ncbi:MAG: hypothetical protein WBW92_12040 [Rhodanobacteraceae bacterium]
MRCVRLLACLALLSLVACGQLHHVFPPAVNIDQLNAPPQGDWTVTLRLHNQSYDANVRFDKVQLDLSLAEVAAGSLSQQIDIDVAERDSDIARISFSPSAAARDKLKRMTASGGSGQLQYTIKGSATISDEGKHAKDFDIEHTAWLSPVPGVPHRYR